MKYTVRTYTVRTDLELPPVCRTEGNYWRALYFEARLEVVNANKGITRLKAQIARLKEQAEFAQKVAKFTALSKAKPRAKRRKRVARLRAALGPRIATLKARTESLRRYGETT